MVTPRRKVDEMTKKDTAVRDAKGNIVDDDAPFGDELAGKYLQLVSSPELMDPAQVARDIAARIMEQETVDDILGMGDTTTEDARDVAERPFKVLATPNWYRSTYEEGPGVFVAMEVEFLDTNVKGVVTVGGSNVIAQLYALQTKTGIPLDTPMRFVVKKSSRGFDVLWLSKAAL